MHMKKFLTLVCTSLLISACNTITTTSTPTPIISTSPTIAPEKKATTASKAISPALQGENLVSLKTKNGDILIKLYAKEAPNTVKNFISKVESGFYNNLTFHRVEPGFVIQGGDPKGNGTGGGNIASELNNIPFKRGSLGLARGGNREISNDSQFYICLETETCSHLDNEYVNFGEVVSGMDIVDKVQVNDKIIKIIDTTK